MASSLAAILTPSPKMSSPSAITSPRLIPTRNSIRFSGGIAALRPAIPCCTSTPQRTASTTLGNSASIPSPVFFTMRPRCSLILGSTSSRKCALRRACVPSSSIPIKREYPATSAARTAASLRSARVSVAKAVSLNRMAGIVTGVAPHSSGKRTPRRPLSLASRRDLAEDRLNQCDSRTYRAKAGMDIEAWLRGLGLEQYAPAFRDNDIDADVVPRLTPEDLTAVGILSVGHRRKLLDAIAALRAEPAPAGERAAEVTAKRPIETPSASASSAERRQLTVMFCDLVGSTALASRLDPEDLREVIGAYHKCVSEVIGRFDGFVAKYMGDGVLAYFGYPQAHEDDAERAVRTGLALVAAVPKLELAAEVGPQVRIGIATGLVVVGDLTGSGEAQERGVVGETPNLAARLQSLAQPGTVVIAPSTRRLTGGHFNYRELGE